MIPVNIHRYKSVIAAIMCSIFVSLTLGLVENTLSANIIGVKRYGYPLAWRINIISQTVTTTYHVGNLVGDLMFWFFFSLLLLELRNRRRGGKPRIPFKLTPFTISGGLFLLSALIMAFFHEVGHALWGILVGGRLAYMQIFYFIIYPRMELASYFRLGYVEVTGFPSSFAHGLFLLGGSLTTSIIAWVVVVILWKKEVRYRTGLSLKMLGIIGVLDLPFYVVFPQLGLRHWILLGGNTPEPLIGAREMGIPEPLFYGVVLLMTFALTCFYLKKWRIKSAEKIEKLDKEA
jgi:hypothetical protein